ncbi:MAG: PBP1A family penicillin-binding protein [Desulfovermiculus sp.]|nr:PBP1A family penicillin-binding protein [Desulfovermiculus sp.]
MRKFLITVCILFGSLALVGLGTGLGLYLWVVKDLPRVESISDYNPPLTTTVYTRNDEVLGHLARENRFLRSLEEMADVVPKCFLAAEDHGFYQHEGIDLLGILRAAIKNIQAGSIVQGGSTITQQVIKALLLTPERSYERKLKEAILAYRLEKNLDKDEILTIYLNEIYLGHGAYGVEAASRVYFGKHVDALNLAEASLLAGLPKAPSLYDPYKNIHLAQARQRYVLNRLLDLEWITDEEYRRALEAEIDLKSMSDPSWKVGGYYLEEVRKWLVETFGEERTYTGGLEVKSNVDLAHQKAAETALQEGLIASSKRRGWQGPVSREKNGNSTAQPLGAEGSTQWTPKDWLLVRVHQVQSGGAEVSFGNQTGWIDVSSMAWCREPNPERAPEDVPAIKDARKVLQAGDLVWASPAQDADDDGDRDQIRLHLEQLPRVQGALFSMDPKTGDIVAMVGGLSIQASQFNRAIQAKRQPGSAFKPIVYSAALDNGFTPAAVLLDAPIVFSDRATHSTWKPENYEQRIFGPTLLRTALVKSRNLVTIRLARQIGIDTVIKRAKALGLRSEFPRVLSVSLGSAEVTLMDLCQAYSAFARDGSTIKPRLVDRVDGPWGKELFTSEPEEKEGISAQTAYIITSLLQDVVKSGTGWRARALGRPVAGKTGTTDDQKDAWFMGYAPYLLTGVFVGFDQPRPMGKYETGSRAASPIWLQYRQAVEDDYPVQGFRQPRGIVMAKVDAANGLLAGPGTEKSYLLPFKAGTQPTRISQRSSGGSKESESEGQDDQDKLKSLF